MPGLARVRAQGGGDANGRTAGAAPEGRACCAGVTDGLMVFSGISLAMLTSIRQF